MTIENPTMIQNIFTTEFFDEDQNVKYSAKNNTKN